MAILAFVHRLRLEKRLRVVLATAVATGLIWLSIEYLPMLGNFKFVLLYFVGGAILLTSIITWLAIWEDIEKIEWVFLPFMPALFTVSAYFFYLLIPARWLTKGPFLIFFAVSFYALLLSSNIFNVGVEKSLKLYRAAFSVNYLYQTIIFFLLSNIIYAMRQDYLLMAGELAIIAFFMLLQLTWTVKLKLSFEKVMFKYAFLGALLVAQTVILMSFLPVQPAVFALALSTAYYVFAGYFYHHYDEKLFVATMREYIFVVIFVGFTVLLTLRW